LVLENLRKFHLLIIDNFYDLRQYLLGVFIQLTFRLLPHANQIAVVGDPNPEEFIQIIGIYSQKLDSLK